MTRLAKIKNDVRDVLTQKVQVGFFTVPVWLLAVLLVVQQVRRHRRAA